MKDDRSNLTEDRLTDGLRALGTADPVEVERLRRSIAYLPDRSRRALPAFGFRRSVLVGLASLVVIAVVAAALLPLAVHSLSPVSSAASATPTSVASPVASPSASSSASTGATPTRPAPTPTLSPTATVSPGPSPTYLAGYVAFNRSVVWNLTDSGLNFSNDDGATWSSVKLPASLSLRSYTGIATPQMAVGSDGTLFVAFGEGRNVRLYSRSPSGAWSNVLLKPKWSSDLDSSTVPDMLMIQSGPGDLVAVAATIGIGMTTAETRLFLSTDDGQTFVQHVPNSLAFEYWYSLAFVDARNGVLVLGATGSYITALHTSDGGTTWAASKVPDFSATYWNYGQATAVDQDIVLPLQTWDYDASGNVENDELHLLVSHDGGTSFEQSGTAVPADSDNTATFGDATWVVAGGESPAIYETADRGETWTKVPAEVWPRGIYSIVLTGPESAIALAIESGCTDFKSGCMTKTWLVRTTDGGHTWTAP